MNLPDNHQAVMPYLIVNDAANFLDFTHKVFDAKANDIIYRDEDNQNIMHAEIAISGSVIMVAQATEQYSAQTAGLFIYVDDADVAFERAIQNGAQVILELEDKDYGRSGGIKDPNGNTMVDYRYQTIIKNVL